MENKLSPVARIWNLVREEKSDITAIYFFAILSGLIQLSIPLGIQSIIGFVMGGTLSASIVLLISVIVTGAWLTGIMQLNQMKIIEKIQQKIFVKYAYSFADRIPKLDLRKVDTFYLPELVNRFFDTVSLQKSISKILLDMPIAMIQILFGLILLTLYHPFFILFGLFIIFLLFIILYLTGPGGLKSSLEESTHKYALAGWFGEMARMVNTFKFSSANGLHVRKANDKTIRYLHARTDHFNVLMFQYKTLIAFKVTITASMLIVGIILLLDQKINIGQFVAAEIIIITVINSIEKIIVNLEVVYDVLTSIEKIGKLTDKSIEDSGTFQVKKNEPLSVRTQSLSFAYEDENDVLKNVSINIPAGNKTAIIGKDGSGKSTLLKLISGIYTDFKGGILLDEIPIGNYEKDTLRSRIGILLPYENIFNGTLMENINLGAENTDTEYIKWLCKKIGLNNFLSTLPLGFDTQLIPTGKRLPKNVIQKILLLRTLVHKPALIILEEPWQGMEEEQIKSMQQLLMELPETTVIIATNDTLFAKKCDSIIDLENYNS